MKVLDVLWSARVKSVGRCERCGTDRNLEAAHILGKGRGCFRRFTAWLVENGICLCWSCHRLWAHELPKEEWATWVNELRGEGTYDKLVEMNNVWRRGPFKELDFKEVKKGLLS